MSELLYNSETGKYETKDPLTGERTVVPTLDELEAQQGQWQDTTMAERSAMRVLPYKIEERLAAEREQQEYARALAAGEGAGDNRPVFAQNPGQFLGDLTKISLNMPLGLATDLADLSQTALKLSPIGQAIDLGIGFAQGRPPQGGVQGVVDRLGSAVDESNNWLTRTRREMLRPETQAGQFASNILRLATPSKLLTAPLKAVGVLKNLDKVTDVAKFASPEALKAVGLVDNVTPGARGAIKAIENAPNRRIPFKVVAEAAKRDTGALAVKNRWQGLETQVATMKASLGIGAPRKQWIKSAAEFIGWDLFMAYNVAGEGDEELDETLGDALQDWTGIGNPLATDWTDNALTLKLKQMADAAIGGTIVGGAIDLFRVQRYARNFSRATAVEQRKILELFDRQAEDIGVRVTNAYDRPMLPTSNINLRAIDAEVVEEPRPDWEQAMDYYSRRTRAQRARTLPGQEPAGLLRGADMGEPGPSTPPAAAVEAPTQGSGVPSPATPREEPPAVPPPGWPEQVTPEAFVSIASELFSMATGPQLDEAIETLGELLPRRRVDLTTFVQDMGVTPNDLNLLPAPQQFVVNRMLRQGVAEGWVELDSNFNPVVRMLRAQEMDLADLDAEAARDFDEVLRLRRMQEENQNNLLMQLLDRPRMAEPAGALAERPRIDLQQEYERFSGEQPDGTVDEFREWLADNGPEPEVIDAEVVDDLPIDVEPDDGVSLADMFRAENDRLFKEGMRSNFEMGRKIKKVQALLNQLAEDEAGDLDAFAREQTLPEVPKQGTDALPRAADEATPPPRARRRGIAKGMAEDLDALMGSVGRMVRGTDEFTQRGLKRLDEREGILADQLNQQIVEATGGQTLDTRGKGEFYHGAAGEFGLTADGQWNNPGGNVYGDGLYVTDDVQTASSYTKKNKKRSTGEGGVVYKVEENVPVRLYDLDAPLASEMKELLYNNASYDSMAELLEDSFQEAGEGASMAQVFDEMRRGSRSFGVPKHEIQEFFFGVQQDLTKEGYGGFTHVGGRLTKSGREHTVRIYWAPSEQVSITKVDPGSLAQSPEVAQSAPRAADEATDPLDRQIAEAEQRAQLSRQRSDMALARAAQDEVDEVSPALAGDTVLDLSGYTPIDPGAPAKVVAARIEELKPLVKNPQDAERLRWAQENLLTDRKRESRLAKRAEYEAAAAAAGRQEPSDIPADLSKLSNKQKNAVMDAFQANPGLRQLWPDRKFVAPWEEEKWARFGAAKWGDDDFAVFDVAQGEGARPIDGRTYPTKQAAQRAADRVNDQGLKQARSIVEEVLSSSGGGTPPKPPKALQELEADEVARQAVAEIDRATREESVVEPLDDFMRQIEENGEICFP